MLPIRGAVSALYEILSRFEVLAFFCILSGFLMFYCVMTLNTLFIYRKDLKNQFSNINTINLSLLTLVIAAYLSIWLIDLIVYLLLFILGLPKIIIGVLNHSSGVINFVFAICIVYKGLKQSDIFAGFVREKYKTTRLSQQEINEFEKKIKTSMANQKPYLDPELNLDNLAEMVSIPPRLLSQVINLAFNQNFFGFVSDYRINEAKLMQVDSSYRE